MDNAASMDPKAANSNPSSTPTDLEALKRQIHDLIEKYQDGHPGMSEAAGNHGFHSSIEDFSRGCYHPDHPGLAAWLLEIKTDIEYRLDVVAKADKYVEMLDLPLPDSVRCHDWYDMMHYGPGRLAGEAEQKRWSELHKSFISHYNQFLFPIPVGRSQIKVYGKGFRYLLQALYLSPLSKDEAESKLIELLTRFIEEDPRMKEDMKRIAVMLRKEDEKEYGSDEEDDGTFYTRPGAAPKIFELLETIEP